MRAPVRLLPYFTVHGHGFGGCPGNRGRSNTYRAAATRIMYELPKVAVD